MRRYGVNVKSCIDLVFYFFCLKIMANIANAIGTLQVGGYPLATINNRLIPLNNYKDLNKLFPCSFHAIFISLSKNIEND